MIDPSAAETAAMDHAGEMAGEYLDHLDKTDLAKLSSDEWRTLIEAICSAYVERLGELGATMQKNGADLRGKVSTDDIPY